MKQKWSPGKQREALFSCTVPASAALHLHRAYRKSCAPLPLATSITAHLHSPPPLDATNRFNAATPEACASPPPTQTPTPSPASQPAAYAILHRCHAEALAPLPGGRGRLLTTLHSLRVAAANATVTYLHRKTDCVCDRCHPQKTGPGCLRRRILLSPYNTDMGAAASTPDVPPATPKLIFPPESHADVEGESCTACGPDKPRPSSTASGSGGKVRDSGAIELNKSG